MFWPSVSFKTRLRCKCFTACFTLWLVAQVDQFQCKVTSKNKKKKTAFVKFYLEDGLSKQKQLVNLSDFIVVEEEEFDY